MQLFNKKLPAWMLLAALVIVGAGAATGLVLKDQITGTTTIAVSQALEVEAPSNSAGGDAFLGTVNDNGVEWAAHFEANNGDSLSFRLNIINNGDQDMHAILALTVPEGLTVSIADSGGTDLDNPVEIAPHTWKMFVGSGADGVSGSDYLTITIAIEDAQSTGFYTLEGVMYPVNV